MILGRNLVCFQDYYQYCATYRAPCRCTKINTLSLPPLLVNWNGKLTCSKIIFIMLCCVCAFKHGMQDNGWIMLTQLTLPNFYSHFGPVHRQLYRREIFKKDIEVLSEFFQWYSVVVFSHGCGVYMQTHKIIEFDAFVANSFYWLYPWCMTVRPNFSIPQSPILIKECKGEGTW